MGVRQFRIIGAITASSLVLLGLLGCLRTSDGSPAIASPRPSQSKPISGQERRVAQTPKTVNPQLIEANTRFGMKLFAEVLKQESNKNVFVSPSSIAIALSMAYNGANGSTQQAMAKALQIQGMSLNDLNQANASLKALLESADPKVQLAIANSLWAREGVSFKPDFIQRNRQFYQAEVTDLDFRSPKAVSTINNWVKQHTRNKIDKIIDRINPDDVMFLINAIYFKGNWTTQFDKQLTTNQPFRLSNGQQKTVAMMSQRGDYRYYETDQFQAVNLPYGDRRVSMVIFLPKQTSNLSQFYKTLTAENWQTWSQRFRSRPGTVQIPRFKMEYDIELNQALSNLGMAEAFGRRANFSNLSDTPMQIDQVKHKTFVEVNEEGTEAAAVTSIGIRTTSIQLDDTPFTFKADRPFFCAIRDNQTGTILFMGAIVNP
ncbi:serpin family protein [Pantanalinema rosaneae CENA516]|uniref:serpin family protein n=1 Tax=Pantanalinema rosaneae TaxID=1620701 RepID=UPI003D6FB0B9